MGDTVLEFRHINKSYPGVNALTDINFQVHKNQIVGLVGENGAGKSTLTKIMVGFIPPDSGEFILRGKPITFHSVKEAGQHGIGMVFQEQALLPNLSVAENIFLGNEELFTRLGLINWRQMRAAAHQQLRELECGIRPTQNTGALSFAERQLVELSRVMALAARSQQEPIIIFDEPTTIGTLEDIERLLQTILRLKERASVVFISHRLEEILRICDHLYVLKDGRNIADMPASETNVDELHRLMVGRERSSEYYRESEQAQPGNDVVLSMQECSVAEHFEDVSLDLRRGEIIGVCGVLGSGREMLCRALSGDLPLTNGKILIEGKPVALRSPAVAKRWGIGYVPVERRKEGLIQYFPVAPNITLANPTLILWRGLLSYRRENAVAEKWVKRLNIKTPRISALARTLSGGNQQKVVLAKWLAAGVKVLVLDHPTRGIDVGSKSEVYALIRELAKQGIAIIMTSENLTEVIALSNRVVVMKDGRVQRIFDADPECKPDEVQLIEYMM